MMYKITDELNINGFSVNPLRLVIQRNNGSRVFNTLDFFCIYIAMKSTEITVEGKEYELPAGSLAFVRPGKNIVFGVECENEYSVYVWHFRLPFMRNRQKTAFC